MSHRIDESEVTAVALCLESGCGWRGLALSYAQALRRVAKHEETQHPRVRHARKQLDYAT